MLKQKLSKKTKIKKHGKEQDKEEQIPNDEILYEPTKYNDNEKPTTKTIRKKLFQKMMVKKKKKLKKNQVNMLYKK